MAKWAVLFRNAHINGKNIRKDKGMITKNQEVVTGVDSY